MLNMQAKRVKQASIEKVFALNFQATQYRDNRCAQARRKAAARKVWSFRGAP
jgi:hypothetical protein